MAPRAAGQTISVVDRSGKVISTSKTLMNVFKDAKAAYSERKAEIVAVRRADRKALEAQRGLQEMTLADDRPSTSTHRSKSKRTAKSRHGAQPHSRTQQLHSSASSSPRRSRDLGSVSPRPSLARRHTGQPSIEHLDLISHPGISRAATTPLTDSFEDTHLAYGEIPPPLPLITTAPPTQENELKKLLAKLSFVLDEANCLQHSVTTTILTLQKDPEALAAVALTLAEISQMAAKVAPGALTALKGSFPAIFALLASPQFLIAAGVGVGITIVAFGGYKIVKKIQAKYAENKTLELEEIDDDVSRIEVWRRGIEFDNMSPGTSVEGEFITPQAMAMRAQAGTPVKKKVKATKSKKDSKSSKRPRSARDTKEKKVPKPSPLRTLFK
jgi:cell division septation protein DedD